MDKSDDIKMRYAKEAATYREEAPLINFDFKNLIDKLLWISSRIYSNTTDKIKVLDIGAGNGMLSELILKYYPNAEITMLDFSHEMLKSAEAYFEENNIEHDHIQYVTSDFITDDFPKKTYDLVISSYVLHHIRDEKHLKKVFLKIASVLNEKTGTFICVDMYLATGDLSRKRQVQKALEQWTKNFDSTRKAVEWGEIIEGEDTPATIPMIISTLYQCRMQDNKIIPLLANQSGDMATVYGMTKLSIEEITKLGLYDLVWSWRDNTLPVGTSEIEYKIDNLSFSEQKESILDNTKKL